MRGREGNGSGSGGRGIAAHSLMESGGSRNYFRAAIRRTEIHSVVVKQSLPLSAEGFRGEGRGRGRKRGRAHAREDPLEARSFRRYRSRPPLIRPLSSARTSSSIGRTSLSTTLGNEEIGFRFYSRNLKSPLLRLSLNAVQFSVSYSLPPH